MPSFFPFLWDARYSLGLLRTGATRAAIAFNITWIPRGWKLRRNEPSKFFWVKLPATASPTYQTAWAECTAFFSDCTNSPSVSSTFQEFPYNFKHFPWILTNFKHVPGIPSFEHFPETSQEFHKFSTNFHEISTTFFPYFLFCMIRMLWHIALYRTSYLSDENFGPERFNLSEFCWKADASG